MNLLEQGVNLEYEYEDGNILVHKSNDHPRISLFNSGDGQTHYFLFWDDVDRYVNKYRAKLKTQRIENSAYTVESREPHPGHEEFHKLLTGKGWQHSQASDLDVYTTPDKPEPKRAEFWKRRAGEDFTLHNGNWFHHLTHRHGAKWGWEVKAHGNDPVSLASRLKKLHQAEEDDAMESVFREEEPTKGRTQFCTQCGTYRTAEHFAKTGHSPGVAPPSASFNAPQAKKMGEDRVDELTATMGIATPEAGRMMVVRAQAPRCLTCGSPLQDDADLDEYTCPGCYQIYKHSDPRLRELRERKSCSCPCKRCDDQGHCYNESRGCSVGKKTTRKKARSVSESHPGGETKKHETIADQLVDFLIEVSDAKHLVLDELPEYTKRLAKFMEVNDATSND